MYQREHGQWETLPRIQVWYQQILLLRKTQRLQDTVVSVQHEMVSTVSAMLGKLKFKNY